MIEPILIKAGDPRLKLGLDSQLSVVDCRVVAEPKYQEMIEKIKQRDEYLRALQIILKEKDWMPNSPTKKYIENLIENK